MAITTKQEAYDFLNQNDGNILIEKDANGKYFGKTETESTDNYFIKDLTAALNIAREAFIQQDCDL